MKARNLFLIALGIALVATAGTAANASCNPVKTFAQWNFTTGTYGYVFLGADGNASFDPTPATPTGGLVGRVWQAGNRTAANEGATCPINTWLKQFGAADEYFIDGGLGADTGAGGGPCDSVGCVVGNNIVLIQTTTPDGDAKFGVGKAAEAVSAGIDFDYPQTWNLKKIGFPAAAVVSKVGSVVTLNLTMPGQSEGDFGPVLGAISGLKLVRAAGTADPGRRASLYTDTGSRTVAAGGAISNFTFDCATLAAGQDLFLAVQVEFDGGQYSSDYVGKATRVKCNSTQADPQFRKIDKAPKH